MCCRIYWRIPRLDRDALRKKNKPLVTKFSPLGRVASLLIQTKSTLYSFHGFSRTSVSFAVYCRILFVLF